jgi:hypothetical protein
MEMVIGLREPNPRGVQEKNQADFFDEISTAVFHSPLPLACGKRVRAASGRALWLYRTEGGDRRTPQLRPIGGLPARSACAGPARSAILSRVCSIKGDAVERIAEAIDQLACDAQGDASGQELATRVAELWLMVSALDPELARRKQRYTTPADDTPSA